MRQDDAPPVTARSHPASLAPGERLLPAYSPARPVPVDPASTDPAFAPWFPQARFALPGPAQVSLSAPTIRMVLADPMRGFTLGRPDGPVSVELPQALLDETTVLERIADLADPPPPQPDDAEGLDAIDEAPAPNWAEPPKAYWADTPPPYDAPPVEPPRQALPNAAAHPAEPLPEEPAQHAYWVTGADPDDEEPWDAELVEPDDLAPAPTSRRARRGVSRVAKIAAIGVVLAAACVAAVLVVPRLLATRTSPVATFNAPMLVLRAAVVGRVATIAVKNGQSVEPSTLLLTIHTEPRIDPAISLLQDRIEAAKLRLPGLDAALAQPSPNTDAGRTRLADLRRQRAGVAAEITQLQENLAATPPAAPSDLPVLAGIHGVVRSLEAQPGTATAKGLPLVRILDCDHAFLTLAPTATMQAGERVQVKLANLPAVAATVRKSVGIAEPPDSLVIAPEPGAFVAILSGSCPLGATAAITPNVTGS